MEVKYCEYKNKVKTKTVHDRRRRKPIEIWPLTHKKHYQFANNRKRVKPH